MAISRKPRSKDSEADRLIRKGGSVASEKLDREFFYVQLRLPKDILNELDGHMDAQRIPYSRHAWILEAIQQRLRRDKLRGLEA